MIDGSAEPSVTVFERVQRTLTGSELSLVFDRLFDPLFDPQIRLKAKVKLMLLNNLYSVRARVQSLSIRQKPPLTH